ncbi:ATP-binding protein [Polaromonas sp. YR568]|uniref:ATP-binding protein n=1 Tax=Polaromonas sp. YR568 TaxID=1855301 RepID=UPI00398BEA57
MTVAPSRAWPRWPQSLFARLMLILLLGILAAQAMSYLLVMYERGLVGRDLMLDNLEKDITSSVAILDRVPAAERAAWLPLIDRKNYRYQLDGGITEVGSDNEIAARVSASIDNAVDQRYKVSVNAIPGDPKRVHIHLVLSDGAPLTINLWAAAMPISPWLPALLLLQLSLLAVCAFFAVRIATRPLRQLANAADALGPDLKGTALPEGGPTEVARASTAFNAMQRRIAGYLTERTQILAAISHDLQTPITRMRLRTDLMDDEEQRGKLQHDLDEMVALVREALTYARSLHGADENPRRVDLDALLDTLRCDYEDAGKPITVSGQVGRPVMSRPLAMRRILTNLADNALKFGEAVELTVQVNAQQDIEICVLDRGPGIPEAELEAVLQPFYRVENSRNRDTGGTGLGLAIAQQLAVSIGARLSLANRPGGGLAARLVMPAASAFEQ